MGSPVLSYVAIEYASGGGAFVAMTSAVVHCTFSRGNTVEPLLDELSIGIINISVKGSAYATATNSAIRAGSRLRVRAQSATGTWYTIWSGFMSTPVSTYQPDGQVITTIPGYDSFGYAASQKPLSSLVSGSLDTRMGYAQQTRSGTANMTRTLVGSDDSAGSAFTAYFDESYSILDEFRIIRNSRRAWLWSSREDDRNVVMRSTATPPPTAAVLTFSDRKADTGSTVHYYTDVDLTHDAESFVTAVTLRCLADGGSFAPGDYGPYRDDTALNAGWQRRDEAIDVTDIQGAVNSTARDYLRNRPTPTVSAKSVDIDVLRNRQIFTQDLIYQPVRVKNAPASHNGVYHIARETHTITPDSWKASYDLKTFGTARSITVTSEDV
jgi:hypothetical protein